MRAASGGAADGGAGSGQDGSGQQQSRQHVTSMQGGVASARAPFGAGGGPAANRAEGPGYPPSAPLVPFGRAPAAPGAPSAAPRPQVAPRGPPARAPAQAGQPSQANARQGYLSGGPRPGEGGQANSRQGYMAGPPRGPPPGESGQATNRNPAYLRVPQPARTAPLPDGGRRLGLRPGVHPHGGPPPPAQRGGLSELKVEDALMYLDDVKREFGDRPKIYNEFLEIMKNFKSQEVDTPGVIDRVSRLFRGYNNLILGFNKFLPDGYKISLQDLERKEAELARQQRQQQTANGPKQQMSGYYQQPGGQGIGKDQRVAQRVEAPGQKLGMAAHKAGGGPPKMQYPDRHGDTPPPAAATYPPNQDSPGMMGQGSQGLQRGQTKPAEPMQHQQPAQQQLPRGAAPHLQQLQQRQPQPQHQAVEFDHAISYVTNIKKRFADDPSTYHQFLEILHTYQKEQRGIKEVLEQVASLFADHPDLLKEFTFFLPDAVQEQAKERLHRAAADSEARQALAAQQRMEQQTGYGNRSVGQGWHGGMRMDGRQGQGGLGRQKFIDMTGTQADGADGDSSQIAHRHTASPSSRKRPFSPGNRDSSGGAATGPTHPETFVYNSAVERQFFEATKEALCSFSRDGGQAWTEFVKCLDLYAQELLSKKEMLGFVEPLLGKRNVELFEEFKRILAAAGSPSGPTPSVEDSWYSVPLSEIDFFRCRQCTPSYRALPRDYPAPPCSERSDEDRRVLNDVWVSLPKGSEESYTFRHMRRNHYEEVLFRCEDERFEIDMVIDSNAATLRRLEPIAEEIAQLAEEEQLMSEFSSNASKSPPEDVGMGGLRYQYTFDPAILGTIQRNSVARIYGDAGKEMLDLMVKNPSVAIPVVVKRLRQKDREWRVVRDRLNRQWKELAEMNYYKSLDHRSLTWRTTDKRATSTRTLVAEIKDRAANDGQEGEAALSARLEKAKEEHGSFYEVTMPSKLATALDLASLPKAYPGMFTPHLSLMYENNSWAQRDAYRILSFALERGATSPADKERCHRMWKEFLGPFFGIDWSWMERPAFTYQETTVVSMDTEPAIISNGEESGQDEEDDESSAEPVGKNVVTEELRDRTEQKHGAPTLPDHHPLPAGVVVSTVYGEAKILRFRQSSLTYVAELPFGVGYLRPNVVLSTITPTEESSYTRQVMAADNSKMEHASDVLCIGTQSLYLFFRLHQILVRRLNIAKKMAYKVTKDETLRTLVEQMASGPNEDVGRKRYEAYLSLVYALVDGGGNTEGGKYEDRVRCLLGHGAYELATMDKLLSHILKNLQTMGHDEIMQNLVQLHRRHTSSDDKVLKPESFRQEAAYLSEGENMFAFQLCQVPDTDKKVLHIEYLGVIYEGEEGDESVDTPVEIPPAKRQRQSKN